MSGENPNNSYISSIVNSVSKYVLDIKNTSVESTLRLMMTEFYKNDTLKNVKDFQGEIVRVVYDKKEFNFSPFNFINNVTNTNTLRYKVWIPDIGNILINKTPSDNNPQESIVIDLLPDFVVTDSSLTNLAVKDIVTVYFLDSVNFKNGIIKAKANKTSTGEAGSVNNNSVSTLPQSAYSSSVPQLSASNGNLQDDEEIQLYIDADKLGKKVKARKVSSTNGSKQLLPIQMAEDFKLMAKDAKAAGFTITANSAYRGLEEQIKIFDERWVINYSYGKPKILPKEKGGENQLNNVGKSKGTAAIPGGSPHNRGVAVDIQIGGGPDFLSKFKTDIYKWLKDNAYKYGFFNTGAKIRSTPEAWHWAYIPSQKGKKETIITPPNSQNTDK